MITVLRTKDVLPATIPSLWIDDGGDFRLVFLDGSVVASEDDDARARATTFRLQIEKGNTVAVVGGGFCLLPKLLEGFDVIVFEILPELVILCPESVEFVPGDWRLTLPASKRRFDVIVYDIDLEVPYDEIEPFLAPGGYVLPLREGDRLPAAGAQP